MHSITKKDSLILDEFQKRCHHFYTCFCFATLGLEAISEKFKLSFNTNSQANPNLLLGVGHPNEGNVQASVKLRDAILFSEKNGAYSDTIAQLVIVAIYAEWDEIYRHRIAVEFNVSSKDITCDLMGELRFIRHWIIHNKSIVDSKYQNIRTLSWPLVENQKLTISGEMFAELMDKINTVVLTVKSTNN